MRSPRMWLILAGLLLVVGVVLVAHPYDDSDVWFGYVAEGDASAVTSSIYLLTRAQVYGWLAAWLASLIVTGVVVRHLVLQRLPGKGDRPE